MPQLMYFHYFQLQHAIKAQVGSDLWTQCLVPVFHYMTEVSHIKGFISRSYSVTIYISNWFSYQSDSSLGERCGCFRWGPVGGGVAGNTGVLA